MHVKVNLGLEVQWPNETIIQTVKKISGLIALNLNKIVLMVLVVLLVGRDGWMDGHN
jgi:hypothetical protein